MERPSGSSYRSRRRRIRRNDHSETGIETIIVNDPYAVDGASSTPVDQPATTRTRRPISGVDVLLWTLAAIFAGTDTALSIAGYTIISIGLGISAIGCLVILLVRHLRRRRS